MGRHLTKKAKDSSSTNGINQKEEKKPSLQTVKIDEKDLPDTLDDIEQRRRFEELKPNLLDATTYEKLNNLDFCINNANINFGIPTEDTKQQMAQFAELCSICSKHSEDNSRITLEKQNYVQQFSKNHFFKLYKTWMNESDKQFTIEKNKCFANRIANFDGSGNDAFTHGLLILAKYSYLHYKPTINTVPNNFFLELNSQCKLEGFLAAAYTISEPDLNWMLAINKDFFKGHLSKERMEQAFWQRTNQNKLPLKLQELLQD